MPRHHRPEWRLPPGVPRGVWEYAQAEHIAAEYDAYFAGTLLFEFDEQVLARHFTQPGLVVDLGCGTGRAVIPLARRGFQCLAVDLSEPMLRKLGEKAEAEGLCVGRLRANLVELGCIRDQAADYCVCLFSTIGMVRARERRQHVLWHARRILKPGGLFVVHAHNFWFSLFDAAGRRWLARHLLRVALRRDVERGDKFFDYRRIPKMYLHTFSRGELVRALRRAGFRIREVIPLDVARQRPLPCRWLLGGLRANGWIVVAERGVGSGE